ncbi:MAG: restriction endonuclease subunit S [Nitrospirae bacterium]|nr:restriction endonuclease subunit S [Nitrospirota bacterium]
MKPIDIRPDALKGVQAILSHHVPGREVRAFGSRVTWTAKEFSDLDLVVMGETPLSISQLSELQEAFSELDLPFKVDIVDWATTRDTFRRIIGRDFIVVQSGKNNVDMAGEWQSLKLEDLGQVVTGKTPPTVEPDNYGGSIPFITPSDMRGDKYIDKTKRSISEEGLKYVRNLVIPANSVLVSCIGSDMGKVGKTKTKSITNQQINAIILREGVDSDFIYYNFTTRKDEFQLATIGSAQPILNKGHFSKLKILLPPLPEQHAIAHILGSLDDKIENNRKMNETLEGMTRAIFKSWFVDFDPVRAKKEGRRPYGMDAATAALFPDSFVDSSIGKIPKGWIWDKLGNIIEINMRSITKTFNHEIIDYIDISSINEGHCIGATPYHLNNAPSRAKRLTSDGDTIWSCVRPNRKSYFYLHKPGDNIVVSTGFVVLTPRELTTSYLYAWTTTDDFVSYLEANADGSAYPAVRPEHFSMADVLVPPKNILEIYEAICKPFRAKIASNESENRTLASIRDTLLPKLISGQIRIVDAERFI